MTWIQVVFVGGLAGGFGWMTSAILFTTILHPLILRHSKTKCVLCGQARVADGQGESAS